MLTSTFKVVLDACVLFPFSLRDTLLRAAHSGLYQPYWSARILEEMRRNLVLTGTTTAEQARALVAQLQKVFPEALVSGHEALVPGLRNHEGDRHVVAAALLAHAQVIVTSNLKHFRARDLPPSTRRSTRMNSSSTCSTSTHPEWWSSSGDKPRRCDGLPWS